MPSRVGIGFALGLCALIGLGCGGKTVRKKAEATPPSHPVAKDAAVVRIKPKEVWRTPYAGRVRTVAVAGGVVVVTSRQRGDRSSARRLAGFSIQDGRLLWQRTTRIRFFERNAPWTTAYAVSGTTLAIAKTADRVEGLDLRTGTKLWQVKATGGVARAGSLFAVAHFDHVALLQPKDGKEVRRMGLGDPQSGAPGNGLMDELKRGTRLAGSPTALLLTRRHGAALQALRPDTLQKRWLFAPSGILTGRPDRIAVGASTLLLPLRYPDRQDVTRVSIWPLGATSGAPTWTATVPGRVSIKRTWVTPTHVIGLSRTRTRRVFLWRVDRKRGTLVDARPFPMPHFCYLVQGALVCKRRRGLTAHDVATLRLRWRYEPPAGQNIRSVYRAGSDLVLEVGKGLVALRGKDGTPILKAARTLTGHPFRVESALGVAQGRLVLAVRHLEGTAFGDRLLLIAYDLATGKPSYTRRLGRYPRPQPLVSGAETEERTSGHPPVLWVPRHGDQPARVYSLFDKTFQVLEARSGRSLFARGVPGEASKRTRLLRRFPDVAVFQRGHRAFGVDLHQHRILWQASLWRVRFELAMAHRVYVSRRKRLGGRTLSGEPPRAPDPEAAGLKRVNRESCRLRWASASRYFCQAREHLLVIDPAQGTVLHKAPRASNVVQMGGVVLTTHPARVKSAHRDAWVGLDLATGKKRWQLPARDGAEAPLPPPLEREQVRPSRWATAAAGLFLVTGPKGRCLHAVDQAHGKRRFRTCLGDLGGPVLPWQSTLLATARPLGADGKASEEQVLYTVSPVNGASREIFRPGAQQRLVLGSASVSAGVLFATVRPAHGAYRNNTVLALRLAP